MTYSKAFRKVYLRQSIQEWTKYIFFLFSVDFTWPLLNILPHLSPQQVVKETVKYYISEVHLIILIYFINNSQAFVLNLS